MSPSSPAIQPGARPLRPEDRCRSVAAGLLERPACVRSEAFAEDLTPAPAPLLVEIRRNHPRRAAGWVPILAQMLGSHRQGWAR
jgi:hypothetical protein